MALQFIDQSLGGIGRSERRIIRSHVMQGKNAGKQRRSSKKPDNAAEIKWLSSAPGYGYVIPRQVLWSDLCATSFPQELDPESKRLMHRWFFDISDTLFPPQFCDKFDIIKSIWANYILADEAYFHSTLAISASYVDFVRQKPISSKTLHHLSKAYASVNTKLSSSLSISDCAMAAVVSLAIYQQLHHQPAIGLVHLKGLHRMIQLRGGIDRLMRENRALAMKPLRLDVELAIQNGTQTLFRGDEIAVRSVLCGPGISSIQFPGGESWMPPIMLDLLSFSKLLDATERTKTPKLDPLDYTETILSLLYRLVDASPLRQAPAKPGRHYGDVKYLAMLSFMTTLLPGLAHNGSNFPFLSDSLARAIQDLCATESASSDYNSPLILWILFISGISVLNMKRHPWLSQLIADSCRRLDLEHWDDIQQHLSQFPWIFSLHKAPGRLLWQDVSLRSKEIPLDVPSRELS